MSSSSTMLGWGTNHFRRPFQIWYFIEIDPPVNKYYWLLLSSLASSVLNFLFLRQLIDSCVQAYAAALSTSMKVLKCVCVCSFVCCLSHILREQKTHTHTQIAFALFLNYLNRRNNTQKNARCWKTVVKTKSCDAKNRSDSIHTIIQSHHTKEFKTK